MMLLLLLVTAGLLYLLEQALYRHLWCRNLTASIRFQKEPVVEGGTGELYEVVTNQKLLPLLVLNVKFLFHRNLSFSQMENTTVSDYCYRNDIFSLLWNQKITRTLKIQCNKRGYYTITRMDLISTDLFMSTRLLMNTVQDTELYVYPGPVDESRLDVPFRKIMGTVTSRRFLYPDPFAFKGIRDYLPTDPLGSVNWKASAHTGNLMVNTYDSTSSQEVMLFLDLADETIWQEEALHEESIRIAAALAVRFLNAGIPIRMVCNGRDVVTGEVLTLPAGTGRQQIAELNRCLARIDLQKECVPIQPFLEETLFHTFTTVPLSIVISTCQNKLAPVALRLSEISDIYWILPMHPTTEQTVFSEKRLDIIPWIYEI
ncbi:MAG: DUF58 domain-containing protein [Lachnospiraceae bacterium]|nr:DUF58 domain-containing protein [Lachnospiraceae bacterium]